MFSDTELCHDGSDIVQVSRIEFIYLNKTPLEHFISPIFAQENYFCHKWFWEEARPKLLIHLKKVLPGRKLGRKVEAVAVEFVKEGILCSYRISPTAVTCSTSGNSLKFEMKWNHFAQQWASAEVFGEWEGIDLPPANPTETEVSVGSGFLLFSLPDSSGVSTWNAELSYSQENTFFSQSSERQINDTNMPKDAEKGELYLSIHTPNIRIQGKHIFQKLLYISVTGFSFPAIEFPTSFYIHGVFSVVGCSWCVCNGIQTSTNWNLE